MLSEQYPELANFLGAWFPDADLDGLDDLEVARRFSSTTSVRTLGSVLEEGMQLLKSESFPWQEVGDEANRYFADVMEAKRWLEEIVEVLSEHHQLRASR